MREHEKVQITRKGRSRDAGGRPSLGKKCQETSCIFPPSRVTEGTSLVAQTISNLPAMWETWFRLWGEEGPLEKGMTTHASILAWRIPWTEEPGGL